MHRNAANALFLSLLVSSLALAQTAAPTQRIRGDVVSVDGLDLRVKERSGEMLTIKLAENYVVTGRVGGCAQSRHGALTEADYLRWLETSLVISNIDT